MSSLTNDVRSAATLTATSRTAGSTITNDTRDIVYLWASVTLPWQLQYPWQYGNGSAFIYDLRT